MNNKKVLQNVLFFLCAALVVTAVLFTFSQNKPQKILIYSEVVEHFKNQEVSEYTFDVGSREMQIKLKDGQELKYIAPSAIWMREDIRDYIKEHNEKNPDSKIKENITPPRETPWFLSILPNLLMAALVFVPVFMLMKRFSGGMMGDPISNLGFAKSKVKNAFEEKHKVTFQDVAGSEEEKDELKEIVEFLKFPRKYNEIGARIPKGVLLVGPPGTGKTLLAKAVAGEAGVPFFSISGSEFIEMYVGLGASRVRDLFDQAKKNTPCIIFIDEIDSVGRHRGSSDRGGSDEREQTLNQLLVEMDGFRSNEGIIVIAATNRGDVLDSALLRPGRFDRRIMVTLPDVKDREYILRVHAKGKPLAPDVVLGIVARATPGFTGADLSNLLNESALLAVREGSKSITESQIGKSIMKVIVGTEKRSKIINDEDKKITAYHEAGHAVTNYFCPNHDPVHEISIIPRGFAAGYTLSLPEEDRSHLSRKEMIENITVLLGGRIAEKIIFGDVSTGASNDIFKATEIARDMVAKYGMSEIMGPVAYEDYRNEDASGKFVLPVGKTYSEKIASKIDDEVKSIISKCYEESEEILKNNVDQLHEVARFLIENEKMSKEKFNEIMLQSQLHKTNNN
ncbi:MAG: ATP-dependent zinc metalloprotease FtsH [Oscillospiraceae bacterium]|nr:ATP-dependent zinc metalloprotease FtsH [Oscillospiraceae bacterium]